MATPRDEQIISLRRGGLTLQAIQDRLGVSKSAVNRALYPAVRDYERAYNRGRWASTCERCGRPCTFNRHHKAAIGRWCKDCYRLRPGSRSEARRRCGMLDTTSINGGSMADEFKCPECGKTFARAASLGAHRQRAHGVAGTSNSAKVKTRARKSTSTRKAVRRRTATNGHVAVNRDSLLRSLFPNGVPPREDVIRDVGEWLDTAERLAKAG